MKKIIYVHGAFATNVSFTRIIENLPEHKSMFGPYQVSEDLEVVINRISEQITHEGSNVSIVGHSLGGLVAVAVAGKNKLVDKVFTMSSPFGGSKVAETLKWFNSHQLYRSMDTGGPVIKNIQGKPLTCKFCSVVTTVGSNPMMFDPNDGVVSVKSQLALSYGEKIQVPLNHFEVLMSDSTVNLLKEFVFD